MGRRKVTTAVIPSVAITFCASVAFADGPPPAREPGARSAPQALPAPGAQRSREWHEGDDIPRGYHVETEPRAGLIIAGSIAFGTAYTPLAIIAALPRTLGEVNGWLAMPILGPVIFSATFRDDGDRLGAFYVVPLVFDALQQAAGVVMFVAAFASPRPVLRPGAEAMKTWWLPTPMSFGRGSAGLGIVGTM